MPDLIVRNQVYVIEKCEYCDKFYLKENLFRWYRYKCLKWVLGYDYICRWCICESHFDTDMVPIDSRTLVPEKPLKEGEKAFTQDTLKTS